MRGQVEGRGAVAQVAVAANGAGAVGKRQERQQRQEGGLHSQSWSGCRLIKGEGGRRTDGRSQRDTLTNKKVRRTSSLIFLLLIEPVLLSRDVGSFGAGTHLVEALLPSTHP